MAEDTPLDMDREDSYLNDGSLELYDYENRACSLIQAKANELFLNKPSTRKNLDAMVSFIDESLKQIGLIANVAVRRPPVFDLDQRVKLEVVIAARTEGARFTFDEEKKKWEIRSMSKNDEFKAIQEGQLNLELM